MAKKEKEWHWAYNVILAGFFIGQFCFISIGSIMLISIFSLIKLLLFCCLIGFFIPRIIYREKWGLKQVEWLMLNLIGFGPLLGSLFLVSNYVCKSESYIEKHAIENIYVDKSGFPASLFVLYDLENNAYEHFPEFRRMELLSEQYLKADTLTLSKAKGLFAFEFVLDVKVVE
jgi:hypothetical protein